MAANWTCSSSSNMLAQCSMLRSRKRGLAASTTRVSLMRSGSKPENRVEKSSARSASANRTGRAGAKRLLSARPKPAGRCQFDPMGAISSMRTMQNCERMTESTGLNGFSSKEANSVAR